MAANTELKITPIQKETLPVKIVKQLKGLIETGQLKPGHRLPSERTLAVRLNVGRPALREALKSLSLLGILENRQRKGTYLTKSHGDWHIDPISIMLMIKKGTLMDIFEARASLEMTIAREAPTRRTADDIENLETIVRRMKRAVNSPENYTSLDQQFHEALAESAKNQVIIDLLKKLNRLYFHTRGFLLRYPEKSGLQLTINYLEHEEILHGVISGDSKRTMSKMRSHLESVRKVLPNYTVFKL